MYHEKTKSEKSPKKKGKKIENPKSPVSESEIIKSLKSSHEEKPTKRKNKKEEAAVPKEKKEKITKKVCHPSCYFSWAHGSANCSTTSTINKGFLQRGIYEEPDAVIHISRFNLLLPFLRLTPSIYVTGIDSSVIISL